MSKLVTVECPSGLIGGVRGLKTKEANLLASSTRRKRFQIVDQILSACWSSTIDQGPYDFDDGIPNWDNILQGDQQYILIQIRIATFGPEYIFRAQCDNQVCREPFQWQLSLDELPVHRLSNDDRTRFKAGNRFETMIDGRKFVFCLPTGHTAKKAAKQRDHLKQQMATLAMRMRILEIENVEAHEMRRFIDDMELNVIRELIAIFDEHDCGIDGDLEIECEECGGIQEITLPFEGEFFFPDRSKKKKTHSEDQSSTSI